MRQNNRDMADALTERSGLAWWYWLPVVAYAGLIFYLSSLSEPEEYVPSALAELGDKVLHAVEYGLLGALCYRAFRHGVTAWAARYAWRLAIIAAAVYGVTDEVHQAFVPLRDADVLDLLMDAIGAAIGATVWRWTVKS